ncbi:hypothetical protein TvY486_0021140 [Trypanosoma vivax Y486]|uniref:Uncharacterized protein n=1 Tax=Trypanosoma vivax (strain Y486) TaxID=1055687 RepID=F9WPD6_TRYVY|nr:hypothetical protein TvY486_0021140 [Trypanosoma vivax Y486]|eukprot:CCD19413.1 hypothetical protein TvY486_0021140 [Trypanosoma vivax Y486]
MCSQGPLKTPPSPRALTCVSSSVSSSRGRATGAPFVPAVTDHSCSRFVSGAVLAFEMRRKTANVSGLSDLFLSCHHSDCVYSTVVPPCFPPMVVTVPTTVSSCLVHSTPTWSFAQEHHPRCWSASVRRCGMLTVCAAPNHKAQQHCGKRRLGKTLIKRELFDTGRTGQAADNSHKNTASDDGKGRPLAARPTVAYSACAAQKQSRAPTPQHHARL